LQLNDDLAACGESRSAGLDDTPCHLKCHGSGLEPWPARFDSSTSEMIARQYRSSFDADALVTSKRDADLIYPRILALIAKIRFSTHIRSTGFPDFCR
jgi:hypothetical protein